MAGISSGDTAWVLASSALVMLMTPGLALFYGGMVRKKNIISTIMLSFIMLALISLQWVIFGYSLAFAPDKFGIIGSLKYVLFSGVGQAPNYEYARTIPHLAFAIFQAMFAIITPALITGAFVERIKFSSAIILAFLWATFVYDPVTHWIWGAGGWLKSMGVLDFAGGSVVHISAGISAVAIAMVIGARRGYGEEPMEPHNIPLTLLGAGLLWFGWFGFNAGSALTSGGLAANAFVVTHIAVASAAFTWLLLSWSKMKPSGLGFVTGAIAGAVAITPASGFVTPSSAIIIGMVAAVICYYTLLYVKKLNLDDSLDVFALHGMGGTWGMIATGIFATIAVNSSGGNGLFYGNASQLFKQIIAVIVTWGYAFIMSYILARVVDSSVGLRVSEDEEAVGLDLSQHAENAYGD